ncbi:uncharacterized protein LOC144489700 [Mustelus asterias]
MAFHCWIASLFLLLVPVNSDNHSKNTGQNCCKNILQAVFPPDHYAKVKSYESIPAHGKCPQLIEFELNRGDKFCATLSKARPLMEAINARRVGPSKDVPSKGSHSGSKEDAGNNKGTTHPPSSPGESTHPHGTGMSTPLTRAPQRQNQSTTPPSAPPSPPSTDAHGHGSVQMAGSTAVSLPGLRELDRITTSPSAPSSPPSPDAQGRGSVQMSSSSTQAPPGFQGLDSSPTPPLVPSSPPSLDAHRGESLQTSSSSTQAPPGLQGLDSSPTPPSVPPPPVATASQGSTGRQMPISSATALPGSQSQRTTSTLQITQALPSTDQPPQEDVTTTHSMKATEMESPHLKNNIATAVTSAPNVHDKEESRTGGHINSHKKDKHYGDPGSGGQRLHVGLALAICLFTVATALLYVTRSWRTNWLVPQQGRDSTRHCNSAAVDLMCYQRVHGDLV